ncbi:aminotransferase class I/II-fold pyridoxal phosphate-dependent enzyme [archaeon]|nr:aminotransferase class I/II-fold pyridoxal phosphate-dependent enzyme [archaeon]MBT4352789.1 aminotransferase class I/II-fold pyridoxal phosphate-dependent enzyme [archaeon]MBT4647843.1 aminotransferase class I/II-fold pyridoxal phosphate-dependent enzyme [archaeon]MBT6821044.1 aminotransferase class I/II-fold pyridoxal phosphate-dependent enzyme [archaeon]MBT7392037.1 aminotransferase class I/II-fold pyridoxal phosphate-dependent enzyme [archaeon]
MITIKDINKKLINTHYAVRGPIVQKAVELEANGKEIIYCNNGNPQSLGQKPLTFVRQVLSLLENPDLISKDIGYPQDIINTAKKIIDEDPNGLGTYTQSAGLLFVRKAIAKFIEKRDGIKSDPNMIHLTDGASKGIQNVLTALISKETDGIMLPLPQYPLYSATIELLGGSKIFYELDEGNNWGLSHEYMEKSYKKAVADGIDIKAIVVINPSNPTGGVLDYDNIKMIIEFAKEKNIAIMADEVYQDNIYIKQDFVSFAKVLNNLEINDVTLFSYHSVSKGYLGECGHRSGYVEYRNIPDDVINQLLKMQAVGLCSNHPGQIVIYLLVNPPKEGDESFPLFIEERDGILSSLKKKAKILSNGLNSIEGITCNPIIGAMYAFPNITIPQGKNDFDYCMKLLVETGICIVPGSGFGQKEGTHHFRTTILPPEEKLREVVEKIKVFHGNYGN